jgi:DNA-binding GntR family transcriptional regulator
MKRSNSSGDDPTGNIPNASALAAKARDFTNAIRSFESEIRRGTNAVGVSHDLAGPLNAMPGAHALAIRRQYLFSSNEMAEVSLSIHPADCYSYTTRLAPQEAETS